MTIRSDATLRSGAGAAPERAWIVFAVAALAMLFAQATVYGAFGLALFAMAREMGWGAAQAGGAFTVLVIACCVAALWPVALIRWIGARWTMAAGCLTLGCAYLLAARTHGLGTVYVAAALSGAGFSLAANTPGIYLIAGWSGSRAPRMIGLYMMLGAAGGAVGPPLADALMASAAGWRGYWLAMALTALLIAVLAALGLREPPAHEPGDAAPRPPMRPILLSPRFLIMAAAMVATQMCVVAVASVTPAHLATRGFAPSFAAQALGAQGLLGALATGLSGFLTRLLPPRRMLTAALLCEAAGMLLLATAGARWQVYGFVPGFGIGSCLTSLAVTMLLVDYFGKVGGTTGLATIWTLSGAAAISPSIAGLVADRIGSFTPALAGFGVLLVPIAVATWWLPPPDPA